jgi:hypothetical protein
MEKALNLFTQWEQMNSDERTFFAGLVEGWNRAPREVAAAQTAPKPRKARKPRAVAQAAAAGV